MAPKPHEVFTPAAPVRDDMFSTRRHEDLQDRLEAVLGQRGRQVVLFGETGVGKTSLVRYLCRQRRIPYERVECGGTFEEMMRDLLARVLERDEVEQVMTVSGEAALEASLWRLLTARGKVSGQKQVKTAKLPRSLAGLVAEAMALAGKRVIFLDNFENVLGKSDEQDVKRKVTQMLKLLSDRSGDTDADVKMVVAGIPSASEELIALDDAAARRTAQIEVPRMPPEELDQILERGGKKLGLAFEGFARDQIVQYSDGFPYYTHLYGLHCAARALRDHDDSVSIEHFERSLDEILADCDLALRRTYDRAAETTGEVRVRKTVMEAMSNVTDLEMPFRRIREEFLTLHPDKYSSVDQLNFISPRIAQLKEMGVLADRGLPKSPNNLYRFRNPLMRAYVRLRAYREMHPKLLDV